MAPLKETKVTSTCMNCHDSLHSFCEEKLNSKQGQLNGQMCQRGCGSLLFQFLLQIPNQSPLQLHQQNPTACLCILCSIFLPSQKHTLDISQWPQWLGDLWEWWNMMKSSFIMNDPSISINFFTLLCWHGWSHSYHTPSPEYSRRPYNIQKTFYQHHLRCELSLCTCLKVIRIWCVKPASDRKPSTTTLVKVFCMASWPRFFLLKDFEHLPAIRVWFDAAPLWEWLWDLKWFSFESEVEFRKDWATNMGFRDNWTTHFEVINFTIATGHWLSPVK